MLEEELDFKFPLGKPDSLYLFFFFFNWIYIELYRTSFNNLYSYFIGFVFLHCMATRGQHLHHEFT